AATGFNTVMTGPYPELLGNVAAEGMKAVVWLGNFINAPRCAFEKDDNTVTGLLKVIAGNQVIAAYYLGDEPHVTECPQAPALFDRWATSNMAGYFVFSWNYQPANAACTGAALDGRADNIGVLKAQNGRVFGGNAAAGEHTAANRTTPDSAVLAIVLALAALLGVLGVVAVRARPRPHRGR